MTGAVWVESCSASFFRAFEPKILTAFEPSSLTAFEPHSLRASQPSSLTAFEPHSLREPKILNAYSSHRLSVQLK